jgi:hypothetical protein
LQKLCLTAFLLRHRLRHVGLQTIAVRLGLSNRRLPLDRLGVSLLTDTTVTHRELFANHFDSPDAGFRVAKDTVKAVN